MKIVGIGLNKTGTTTLGHCLLHWRLKHVTFDPDAFQLWRQGDELQLLRLVEQYDSFEDWPWALIFPQIDRNFPGTKFILTRRKSADVWFHSLCKHAERTGPTEVRKSVYGFAMPHGQRDEHVRIYDQHLQAVRNYFKHRPDDLLEVCWGEGDGWGELANFLKLPDPNIPFPHANRRPTRIQKTKGAMTRWTRRLAS